MLKHSLLPTEENETTNCRSISTDSRSRVVRQTADCSRPREPACRRSPGTRHPDLDTAPAAPAVAAPAVAAPAVGAPVDLRVGVRKVCPVHDTRPDWRRYCTAFAPEISTALAVAAAGWSSTAAAALPGPCDAADSPRALAWKDRAVGDAVPARAKLAVGPLDFESAPGPARPEP